ncbi:hypothetical protein [Streptomyces sp. NPDC058045]|uniref:hypothetical protein n=1 Tax=Streptomyces sp. NPDC058045 TaxID=3346311 RepID=UPI0036E3DCC5
MLALRLTRRARPGVHLRRALVATASAGTGFLLLCTLGYALGHPDSSGPALLRLAWCVAPLAATVYLAVAVARTDPATRPRAGLSAVGLGPGRLMLVSTFATAAACSLGSLLAALAFLYLRGVHTGLPFDGAAADLLAAGRPLPAAAVATLLAVVPVTASAAGALALRPRPERPADDGDPDRPPAPARVPTGLPWGMALLAAGLAVEAWAGRGGARSGRLPLPGGLAAGSLGVLVGWALTAVGLAVAGPALTHHCGRLLSAVRPGGLRLLAGRILQQESRRIGRPLGVLCAVASGVYAALSLRGGGSPGPAPMTTLGMLLVAGCALATLLVAAVEARQSRAGTKAALLRLGAPPGALRGAVALRSGALLVLFLPLTWLIAKLAALPLTN